MRIREEYFADSIELFDKLRDFEKGDGMACSLLRSCTKVLREGKNTSNAQKIIYKTQNQEDLLQNPPDFLLINLAQRSRTFSAFFFVRVPGDFIDSLNSRT